MAFPVQTLSKRLDHSTDIILSPSDSHDPSHQMQTPRNERIIDAFLPHKLDGFFNRGQYVHLGCFGG